MTIPLKKITLLGLFIALGVALGFLLAGVPNVELVTATVFIAGYMMGIREGLITGLVTESIYSMLNPYGIAAPPLFTAQILSMGLAGLAGGILGTHPAQKPLFHRLRLGISGFLLTLFFAAATTLAYVLFIGLSSIKIAASLFAGLGFYAAHLISNTLIFIILVPLVLHALKKTGWFNDSSVLEAS